MFTKKALAQNPIDVLLQSPKHGQWSDQFDARASETKPGTSTVPVFSEQTPGFIEAAMEDYRRITANGGWPVVPATDKLELGAASPAVTELRKRLIISGDLAPGAGGSPIFDSWVEGAVRRFQSRHGLPPDGVLGKYTFAAMNIPANIRLGQLETNLVRLRSMSGFLGDRYVMVNIPAAAIEVVEFGKVVQRHTAVVGKIDRQTPILNSKIHEVILNPYWTAPKSIIQKDIIPLMQKDPTYLTRNNIRIHQRGDRRGGVAGIHRLELGPGGQFHASPGPGQDQRHGVHEDQFPQSARRLHARHAAADAVQPG